MTEQSERVRAALPAYDIGTEVGRGGCGVVLAGMHRKLRRPVAIKQIPAQFAHDAQVRRRFVAEARVLAAIDHPHVVRVFDYLEHDDLCLLVMEYLPGGTVGDRFATDGYDAATALAIALSCAAGLEAAHRHRVLHRDVKPANLMFAAGGAIKLTDFGIAKIVGGDETWVTKAGDIIGTPSYIAPEQARGQQLSPATDVYALATMLYQLLSGVLPFPPGDGPLAMLFAHAFDEPIPLSEVAPSVPEPIAAVVMRGLATDPAQRFDTAESFGVALAQPAAYCWGEDWLTPVGIPVIGADTIVAAATGGGRTPSRAAGQLRTPPVTPAPRPPYPPSGADPPTTPWFATTPDEGEMPSEKTPPPFGPALPSAPWSTTGPPPSSGDAPPTVPWHPGSHSPVGGRPAAGARPSGGASPPAGVRPPAGPRPRGHGAMPFRGPVTRVRPLHAMPDSGVPLAEIDRRDLVPIQEVVSFESPRVPFAVAGVLALAAVVLAVLGLGAPTIGGDLSPGAVTLGGVDPATTPVDVDLAKPIPLRVNGIDADAASLKVTVLGVPVGGETVPFVPGDQGAVLPAPINQYVMAGTLTGELVLLRNGSAIAAERVELQTAQRPTTTATAAGVVLLALFSLAYLESNMRRLRRGRGGFANSIGLAVSASLLAVALVGAAWILLEHPPTTVTTAGSAAFAAAAGLAASLGARRIGKRHRYLRRARRRPQS
ncbi:serine/threonine-protein kinase [Nocardia iowensis]|uniref:non-specific serine/threonine protein kinase n=1 Tax=Nocardia iowensis TaxID=204891 RepID=A0ABX8RWF3_NOCIO|nr:serine/threonine-protein kinase [Nocardia iowensis]QXN93297.1 protein kinase [Nocardia iowensis]